jgi:hypothetical protein
MLPVAGRSEDKMKMTAVLALAVASMATPALADTHYMHCYGGGQKAIYFSAVYPVGETVKGKDEAPRFNAFVQSKYGTMIHSECHRDGKQADADSAKKINENSFRTAKVPYNVVETGWAGK